MSNHKINYASYLAAAVSRPEPQVALNSDRVGSAHLSEVEGEGDSLEVVTPTEGRTLPPGVPCPVHCRLWGVSLVRGPCVADRALPSSQLAVRLRPPRPAAGVSPYFGCKWC